MLHIVNILTCVTYIHLQTLIDHLLLIRLHDLVADVFWVQLLQNLQVCDKYVHICIMRFSDMHMRAHTHIPTSRTKVRNQACTGLWLVHA